MPDSYNNSKNPVKVAAGQKGGMSRSEAKRHSSSSNLAAARLKRWPGREANLLPAPTTVAAPAPATLAAPASELVRMPVSEAELLEGEKGDENGR